MKKTCLLLLMYFIATAYAEAQNKKIYVSRHGGAKKMVLFGKTGYNSYHFSNYASTCDTLICSGAGYERCKIDKSIIKSAKEDGKNYALYNKAIQATEKHARKSKKGSGQFNLAVGEKKLSIKYINADQKGNADIEIEML
jgi:arginyl-tRNA--protein-N-Asp/Glu arginylyltransferase